jgi:CheY-like chemotaxis protein
MNEQKNIQTPTTLDAFKECAMAFTCPSQVLVVDRVNGPADNISDLLGRLFDQQLSTLLATGYEDAIYALNCCEFDLVIIGINDKHADQMAVLRHLHAIYPCVPVVAIGSNLTQADLQRLHQYEVQSVIEAPRRAAELKSAVFSIKQRYLQR